MPLSSAMMESTGSSDLYTPKEEQSKSKKKSMETTKESDNRGNVKITVYAIFSTTDAIVTIYEVFKSNMLHTLFS